MKINEYVIEDLSFENGASIRKTLHPNDLRKTFEETFMTIWEFTQKNNMNICNAPFTYYHSCSMEEFDVTYAMPVDKEFDDADEVKCVDFMNLKALSIVKQGSYKNIRQAYVDMFDYAKEQNIDLNGEMAEIYYNDPAVTPEDEILTKLICFINQ